ncbi:MAG: DUF3024 domain-containing protein [Cyclobacteriaceae bacterium]
MALDILQAVETIEALENFLDRRRPPEHIRPELDLAYRIEDQSVIIYSIRPHWQNKSETTEGPIAKTTWVHTQQLWKVYWMRADRKWHGYEPNLEVKTIEQFLTLVDEDEYGCFWG